MFYTIIIEWLGLFIEMSLFHIILSNGTNIYLYFNDVHIVILVFNIFCLHLFRFIYISCVI